MPRLKGLVAFVTGAGRGIGQGMALAFAAEGAIVGVADIDPVTAGETVREIEKNAGTARAFPIDVSKRDDFLRAVDEFVAEFAGSISSPIMPSCFAASRSPKSARTLSAA